MAARDDYPFIRDLAEQWIQPRPDCAKALDEIDRLRAALADVASVFADVDLWSHVSDDTAHLCDEVANR